MNKWTIKRAQKTSRRWNMANNEHTNDRTISGKKIRERKEMVELKLCVCENRDVIK